LLAGIKIAAAARQLGVSGSWIFVVRSALVDGGPDQYARSRRGSWFFGCFLHAGDAGGGHGRDRAAPCSRGRRGLQRIAARRSEL
jgi:hypothetical protein